MKVRLLFVVLVFGLVVLLGFNILSYAKQNSPPSAKSTCLSNPCPPNLDGQANNNTSQNPKKDFEPQGKNSKSYTNPADTFSPAKQFAQKKLQERKEHLLRCPKDKTKNNFTLKGFKSFKNSHHKFDIPRKGKFNIKQRRNKFNLKHGKSRFNIRQNAPQLYNSATYSELDEVIEIDTDITTNTIWEAGNVYHVIADVNVKALLVIEPGTVVQYSSSGALFVNNGGTLIARGTPDELITFTSDSTTPGYSDYYSAIYIDQTASVSTKITYSVIEFAYVGILTNNIRLDSPIQNNYIQYCTFGIGEFGTEHTDIINNQIFGSYYNAIEVYMASLTGTEDSSSHILLQNNTCDYYQYTGITVHGVTLEENAGVSYACEQYCFRVILLWAQPC